MVSSGFYSTKGVGKTEPDPATFEEIDGAKVICFSFTFSSPFLCISFYLYISACSIPRWVGVRQPDPAITDPTTLGTDGEGSEGHHQENRSTLQRIHRLRLCADRNQVSAPAQVQLQVVVQYMFTVLWCTYGYLCVLSSTGYPSECSQGLDFHEWIDLAIALAREIIINLLSY